MLGTIKVSYPLVFLALPVPIPIRLMTFVTGVRCPLRSETGQMSVVLRFRCTYYVSNRLVSLSYAMSAVF